MQFPKQPLSRLREVEIGRVLTGISKLGLYFAHRMLSLALRVIVLDFNVVVRRGDFRREDVSREFIALDTGRSNSGPSLK